MSCDAEGDPMPDITWTKASGELPVMRHHITNGGTLQIRNLDLGDAGFYICTATNIWGSAQKRISLTIEGNVFLFDQ